jgi:DNA replication protein DnaC
MTTPSNSLPAQLEQIGLHAVASGVDDFLARATKQRWSPRQILEHLAQTESAERAHRSLKRRLRLSEIKKFKPIADFDWSWPKKIERDVIERILRRKATSTTSASNSARPPRLSRRTSKNPRFLMTANSSMGFHLEAPVG